MNFLKLSNIINLPVFTKSNQFLGNVYDIEIDSDSGKIIRFYVSDKKLLKKILGQEKKFIIHFSQVISLTQKKMVVEDSVRKREVEERLKRRISISAVGTQ